MSLAVKQKQNFQKLLQEFMESEVHHLYFLFNKTKEYQELDSFQMARSPQKIFDKGTKTIQGGKDSLFNK